ncbi:MAG: cytidylyltransferase domain-containing protein [Planctomycetota bacterium]|jgi:spore coat polysaccharide biosynthesis protein SpsF
MKTIAIVQARMSSRRLPGKVLRSVAGKPLLGYLLEGLSRCRCLDAITVATSTEAEDDAIARFCERSGVRCHRGHLHDVAARMTGVIEREGADAFVRVCADSPLLDHRLVDRLAAILTAGAWDVVTNVMPRTFPAGQSVEVIRSDALRDALARMRDPADREHVTPFLYRNTDRYRMHNVRCDEDRSAVKLAVDVSEDLQMLGDLITAMERRPWEYGYRQIVALRSGIAASPGSRAA